MTRSEPTPRPRDDGLAAAPQLDPSGVPWRRVLPAHRPRSHRGARIANRGRPRGVVTDDTMDEAVDGRCVHGDQPSVGGGVPLVVPTPGRAALRRQREPAQPPAQPVAQPERGATAVAPAPRPGRRARAVGLPHRSRERVASSGTGTAGGRGPPLPGPTSWSPPSRPSSTSPSERSSGGWPRPGASSASS